MIPWVQEFKTSLSGTGRLCLKKRKVQLHTTMCLNIENSVLRKQNTKDHILYDSVYKEMFKVSM